MNVKTKFYVVYDFPFRRRKLTAHSYTGKNYIYLESGEEHWGEVILQEGCHDFEDMEVYVGTDFSTGP